MGKRRSVKKGVFFLVSAFAIAVSVFTVRPATAEWDFLYPSKTNHVLRAVWGSASNNYFAVGARGYILHYDGTRWSRSPSGNTRQLRDVHGSSDTNVYAVGNAGVILRYDGSEWEDVTEPASIGVTLHAVWVNSSTDVFAGGSGGVIVHWDGSQWTRMTNPSTYPVKDMWGTAPNNVYAVCGNESGLILRYDGSQWTTAFESSNGTCFDAIWGSSTSDIWAAGYPGTVAHYDGNQWSEENLNSMLNDNEFHGVWGSGPDDVFVGGPDGILRWDGSIWSKVWDAPNHGYDCIHGVWGSGTGDAFAVGCMGGILHYDGSTWIEINEGFNNSVSSGDLEGVWGSAANDVYAVGDNFIGHFDGSDWTKMSVMVDKKWLDVHGVPAGKFPAVGKVFAVGYQGAALKYDGTQWVDISHGTSSLYGVWAISETEVYAVGDGGTILRYGGSSWSEMNSGVTGTLTAVWAAPSQYVYAVGVEGKILRYNRAEQPGTQWENVYDGGTELYDIWGASANDIYAVAAEKIFHYDGSQWSEMGPQDTDFRSVWGGGAGDVFAATGNDVWVYDGTGWHDLMPQEIMDWVEIEDIWGIDSSDIFLVGKSNRILRGPIAGFQVCNKGDQGSPNEGDTATFDIRLKSKPSADVTVGITSTNTDEITVSPVTMTFTPANWFTPQSVSVVGAEDDIDDEENDALTLIRVELTATEDPLYQVIDPDDAYKYNLDDDTAGITVGAITGPTTEAGGTATFTVRLDSEPTADVTVGVSSSDTTEGTVSATKSADDGRLTAGAELVFTPANWDTEQTVTVTGVDDDIDDGDVVYTVLLAQAVSDDTKYAAIDPSDVSVTNTNDDTAGITVGAITGPTTEAGGQATFTVRLDSEPTADVTVGVSSSDATEGTVSAAKSAEGGRGVAGVSLVFTSANWNTAQTVTVTGVGDDIDDGDVGYTVVLAQAVSSDPKYAAIDPSDVSVVNTDNDTAGYTISAISGPTTEAGGQATFTVRLNTEPTGDVEVGVSSSDTTEGTVSVYAVSRASDRKVAGTVLYFTTGNWSAAQTVTVTGVDDDIDDDDVGYTIVLAKATTSDAEYAAIDPSDVSVTNTDDDTAGFTVGAVSGPTSEGGGQATFTVRLNTEPVHDVTIGVSSSDTTEGTVSVAGNTVVGRVASGTELIFTAANWNVDQTVTVTGIDDDLDDDDIDYTIVLAQAVSDDAKYAAIDPPDVDVTNIDDEFIKIVESDGLTVVDESGATDSFTVVLDVEPGSDVTLDVTSLNTAEATVSPARLTFTPANWSTPQIVTVTGVEDNADDRNQWIDVTVAVDPAASADAFDHARDKVVKVVNTGRYDEDNIDGVLEDAAPNQGDGDASGVPDKYESHVTSLPDAVDGDYLTLKLEGDCYSFEAVSAHLEDEYGEDPNFDYPQGLVNFELSCSSAVVTVFFHGVSPDQASPKYRKFTGTEPIPFMNFENVSFGSATIDGQDTLTATLTLRDGEHGDLDGIVNDKIKDPGAVAFYSGAIPTLNQLGVFALILLLGVFGWTKARNKK